MMRDPAIDGNLADWLHPQLLRHRDYFANRRLLVDVGAYQGEFSRQTLIAAGSPFQEAVLFEPQPANVARLRERFAANPAVRIESSACDVAGGSHEFYCAGETYTGSLLNYRSVPSAPLKRITVTCVTLDAYLRDRRWTGNVGLIKTDTQGNDLRALQGAEETLAQSRPWLVVELIYAPLYQGQAHPHELAAWLAAQGYVMAAQFDEYYSRDGWLGWSDGVFVPQELTTSRLSDYVPRPNAAEELVRRNPWNRLKRNLRRMMMHGRD
jgi:FkbM family methyltransferase